MTKSKKERYSTRKKEGFYKEAKKLNVRSRSYFKLEMIDKKFNIIKEGSNIIDLGSAPGGWLEYIDQKVKGANVIGIDLLEIKNIHQFSENIQIIEDDFENIEDYNLEPFDLVLSDMAPEFSGDSHADRGRTHKLNLKTLDFSKKHLKKGGTLVFKTFEGEDLQFVRRIARENFKEVKDFKPKSSQKKSAEVFIICQKKL